MIDLNSITPTQLAEMPIAELRSLNDQMQQHRDHVVAVTKLVYSVLDKRAIEEKVATKLAAMSPKEREAWQKACGI